MGKIDILVCNAGIAGPAKKSWEYSYAEWRSVVNLDLDAVFVCCQSLISHMMDNGYGRIVNIASIAGKEGNPNACAYSAAKAGVIGLTKSLAKETAEAGVIINCVTPAAIRTAIFDQITQEHVDYMLSRIPMGRLGQVDEAAALVAWLSSQDCSFSTGGVFDLSGGRATY
jgi:3-oxoacyl-[acyl-carrier protein] reductase